MILASGSKITFSITSLEPDRGGPRAVKISVGDVSKVFEKLAEPVVAARGDFRYRLTYVADDTNNRVYAVGRTEVVLIDCNGHTLETVAHLFRTDEDDSGFYRIKIVILEEGFVLAYEGGALLIESTGRVRWHIKLFMDDIYLDSDNEFLYYSSEFGEFAPEDWVISLKDGRKLPRPMIGD